MSRRLTEDRPRRRRRGVRTNLVKALAENSDGSLSHEFRHMLHEEMKKRGLNEVDLALGYGCSLENIYQLLDRGRDFKLETADKLCRALGLRLSISIQER